jgi:hypothetical protein
MESVPDIEIDEEHQSIDRAKTHHPHLHSHPQPPLHPQPFSYPPKDRPIEDEEDSGAEGDDERMDRRSHGHMDAEEVIDEMIANSFGDAIAPFSMPEVLDAHDHDQGMLQEDLLHVKRAEYEKWKDSRELSSDLDSVCAECGSETDIQTEDTDPLCDDELPPLKAMDSEDSSDELESYGSDSEDADDFDDDSGYSSGGSPLSSLRHRSSSTVSSTSRNWSPRQGRVLYRSQLMFHLYVCTSFVRNIVLSYRDLVALQNQRALLAEVGGAEARKAERRLKKLQRHEKRRERKRRMNASEKKDGRTDGKRMEEGGFAQSQDEEDAQGATIAVPIAVCKEEPSMPSSSLGKAKLLEESNVGEEALKSSTHSQFREEESRDTAIESVQPGEGGRKKKKRRGGKKQRQKLLAQQKEQEASASDGFHLAATDAIRSDMELTADAMRSTEKEKISSVDFYASGEQPREEAYDDDDDVDEGERGREIGETNEPTVDQPSSSADVMEMSESSFGRVELKLDGVPPTLSGAAGSRLPEVSFGHGNIGDAFAPMSHQPSHDFMGFERFPFPPPSEHGEESFRYHQSLVGGSGGEMMTPGLTPFQMHPFSFAGLPGFHPLPQNPLPFSPFASSQADRSGPHPMGHEKEDQKEYKLF